eukprot:TRINITY_DN21701_c1_g1_i1.p1 TRINITY_DN21701_c1_g1~~TRINITY_DN21701_c1_g1_i1.p1  ORF type:complete len:1023 (+),score=335.00 TRINITY_DN21701_c1_g1_i1:390-3071(+)
MGFAGWLSDTADLQLPVKYSVFGLGDTRYEHFAAFGRFVDRRLEEVGGSRVHPLGTSDASKGDVLGEFRRWAAPLLPMIGGDGGPRKQRVQCGEAPLRSCLQQGTVKLELAEEPKELCGAGAGKSTVDVVMRGPTLPEYRAGDHLGVYPCNPADAVERALRLLRCNGSEAVVVSLHSGGAWTRTELPAKEVLLRHVDLTGRAGADTLRALLPFASTLPLRAQARELTHVPAVGEAASCVYDEWEAGRWLSVLDLFELFQCAMTVGAFVRASPKMQPRLYSIASADGGGPDGAVSICVSVDEKGLCSRWLAGLRAGSEVDCFVRPSAFQPPPATPLLMFGSGSGVAPLLAILRSRAPAAKARGSSCDGCGGLSRQAGPLSGCTLYTGFQRASCALYTDELQRMRADGLWWVPVLSREAGEGVPRAYVQHAMLRASRDVWEAVRPGGSATVMLCGRLDMAVGVRKSLMEVARTQGGMAEEEAASWLESLTRSGRLLSDVWEVTPSAAPQPALEPDPVPVAKRRRPRVVVGQLQRHAEAERRCGSGGNDAGVSSSPDWPGYLRLLESGELQRRVRLAEEMFTACVSCGRECEVNRLSSDPRDWGECKVGQNARVYSAFPHFGEEDCLRGERGSGTIFFGECNLKCSYCQNWEISDNEQQPDWYTGDELGRVMLKLQRRGCHNINFVSPTHNVLVILRGVLWAASHGLKLPLVWNTGGYDTVASLRLLEGIIDIYMPDMKYANRTLGRKLSRIDNYPEVNQSAVKEMHRQVGELRFDSEGMATRGVLVRHLVLPNDLAGTTDVMRFLVSEVSRDTYVNVMEQYRPEHRTDPSAKQFDAWTAKYELHRHPTRKELRSAKAAAERVGIRRFDDRCDVERFNPMFVDETPRPRVGGGVDW